MITRAKAEKKVATILRWAKVIGLNTNWQSALPVYTLAAKADKAQCTAKDPLYALDLSLSSPADHPRTANALAFMNACMPKGKDTFAGFIAKGSYARDTVCKFLTEKKALPDSNKAECAAAAAAAESE